MQDSEVLDKILDIKEPWYIMGVMVSHKERRLDIHISYKGVERKRFFGFGRKKSVGIGGQSTCQYCKAILPLDTDYPPEIVRHLDTVGFATYLHVPPPGLVHSSNAQCACMRVWREPETSCSKELYKNATSMLTLLKNSDQVKQLLNLTTDELKQIVDLSGFSDPVERAEQEKDSHPPNGSSDTSEIDQLRWLKLVKGELALETKVVALSMLLSKVQSTYQKSPTFDAGASGVKVLRHFFQRNKRLLKKEIAILSGAAKADIAVAAEQKDGEPETSVPPASALVWKQFAKGKMKIETNQVGLQMLLGQIQKTMQQNPVDSVIEFGIRNIRNYFIKNERRLGKEIAQLKRLE